MLVAHTTPPDLRPPATAPVKTATVPERPSSANERFKARWRSHLTWATGLAVAAHAAAFGLTPGWGSSERAPEASRWQGVSLVALPPLDAMTSVTGAPAAPLALPAEEDTEARDGTEDGAVIADVESEPVDLWDAIGERLKRRGALVPALTQPEEEPRDESSDGEEGTGDGDDPAVGGEAMAIDVSELPEPGSLDLDRLSMIQPELALQTPSAWVLIRNPAEVETFMRRGYLEGALDPAAEGSVSVTLWIDQRGAVQWAEISESSGRLDLDEYALALFNEVAAFKAAREGGVFISRSVTLAVNFPW